MRNLIFSDYFSRDVLFSRISNPCSLTYTARAAYLRLQSAEEGLELLAFHLTDRIEAGLVAVFGAIATLVARRSGSVCLARRG